MGCSHSSPRKKRIFEKTHKPGRPNCCKKSLAPSNADSIHSPSKGAICAGQNRSFGNNPAHLRMIKAYAQAGVDIDLGNRVKAGLPRMLASTHRPEVLGKVGGFGGLFALDTKKYREPVLVSSVDGVGTKLKIAFALGKHDTIGQDLVNHCVDDIAVLGAEPLFFLDYIGT